MRLAGVKKPEDERLKQIKKHGMPLFYREMTKQRAAFARILPALKKECQGMGKLRLAKEKLTFAPSFLEL